MSWMNATACSVGTRSESRSSSPDALAIQTPERNHPAVVCQFHVRLTQVAWPLGLQLAIGSQHRQRRHRKTHVVGDDG
jgi:hypothetical protein